MIRLAALSIVMALYGQLIYSALYHYFTMPGPSYPVWIGLYGATAWFLLPRFDRLKFRSYDLYMGLFLCYMLINFLVFGQGDSREFAFKMVIVLITPYIVGRVLGQLVELQLLTVLKWMCVVYVVLVVVGVVQNPELLMDSDRLILFNSNYNTSANNGGDSTLYNLGITWGSMWVAEFAVFLWTNKYRSALKSNYKKLASIIIIPMVILAIGSRSSLVSMLLVGVVLFYSVRRMSSHKRGRSWFQTIIVVSIATVGLFVSYNHLPESRKALLNEFVLIIERFNNGDIDGNTLGEGGSFMVRVTMWTESLRMFKQSPLFGGGASNFGYNYCDQNEAFASPHSIVMHIIAELGLIGIFLFTLLIGSLLYRFYRVMKDKTHSHHLATWTIFALWLFIQVQLNFTGNLFVDYHFFLITGIFASCLQSRPLRSNNISSSFPQPNAMHDRQCVETLGPAAGKA